MNKKNGSLLGQLQRNSVAIISLVVALSSLGYTTWRNEKTEENRNQRHAAFEVLMKLNQFQQVIFHRRYDNDQLDKGNPRTGWTYALTIQDMSRVLQPPLPAKADQLIEVWTDNWATLGEKQSSVDTVLASIDDVRIETLQLLKTLE